MKAGFKQTEIGWVPEEWEVIEIGESFSFKNGLNKESRFFGYGFPIVNYMDVFKNTFIEACLLEGKVFISSNELKSFRVTKGDVLFTRTSETPEEIAYSSVVVEDLINTVFSGFVLRARPFNERFSEQFCRFCFSNSIVRRQIVSNCTFTTRALTNGRVLSKVIVPLPPLPEQRAIAAALSDADAWIESLEALLDKKRHLKQGAMQHLLTPKEGWEVKRLGEVAEIIIGLTYTPADVREFGTLVLRSSNIQGNKLAYQDNVYVEMDLPERVLVKEDDILLCVRNGSKQLIGKCALINKDIEEQAFGAFMSIVRSQYGRYIFYYFQSSHVQRQIDENLGATINQLTNAVLKSFLIYMPPSSTEQTHIATILSDMDTELESLEQQLAKARRLKQGMMQEVLTGRVRLV